jgi:hypothetical protein
MDFPNSGWLPGCHVCAGRWEDRATQGCDLSAQPGAATGRVPGPSGPFPVPGPLTIRANM